MIATDKSGNLRARRLTLETPTPERFQGVVCTLKDSFGFIERADVVREIFFHSSECKDFKDLTLGDDVEFSVHTRNDKEVAISVSQLEPGTVVFEDISTDKYVGQVMKTVERPSGHRDPRPLGSSVSPSSGSEPFPGKLRYKRNGNEMEISFGERDMKGEYTLQPDDFVKFNIVTDRRDKLQHATNVELHEENFTRSGETREQGYIASLRDSYGFIKCLNREGTRVYFRLAELLDPNTPIKLNDEVEFTISPDLSSPGRLQAIRIKVVPNGTIMKNLLAHPRHSNSGSYQFKGVHDGHNDAPLIDLNSDAPTSLPKPDSTYGGPARTDSWSEILSQMQIPINSNSNGNLDDEDSYNEGSAHNSDGNLANEKSNHYDRNNQTSVYKNERSNSQRNGTKPPSRGFIAALKDSYGFIENEDHQTEVFFHFSVYEGNVQNLQLGNEVEYTASVKSSKLSAEYVKKLPSNTIPKEDMLTPQYSGTIVRSVRCLNPEQDEYPGYVLVSNNSSPASGDNQEDGLKLEFSMTSLGDIHDFVQKGDEVTFQVGVSKEGKKRAVNIKPIRNKYQV